MQQSRCALLLLIVGTLIFSASCGDEQVAPTSGAAGRVILVQGEVSAKRGDEASRPLAVNDVVYVKDTLTTGEGASVEIEFRHNGARWSLAESQVRPVNESLVWRAERQSDSHFANDKPLASASAGAHDGKEAAESASTAPRRSVAPEAERIRVSAPQTQATEPADIAADDVVAAEVPIPKTIAKPKTGNRPRNDRPMPKEANPDIVPTPKTKPKPRSFPTPESKPIPQPRAFHLDPGTPVPGPGTPTGASADTGGDGSSTGDNRATEAKTKDDKGPEARKRVGWLQGIAARCHDKRGGKGTVKYKLTIRGGKFVSFEVAQPGSFGPAIACMRKALQSADLSQRKSGRGSVFF